MDTAGLREDGAQDGGSADLHPRQLPKLFRRRERYPRYPQRSTEIPCDKRLVIRRHIEVELRLLAVAEEDGLDYMDSYLGVYVLAVLHRKSRIGINPLERDAQGLERLINLLLQLRRILLRRSGHYIAYLEHIIYYHISILYICAAFSCVLFPKYNNSSTFSSNSASFPSQPT